uniref:Uncharacterized protein n=1 Tax=Trichogramma kaykai TaxID=54128 RepID=A0ABD2X029_9HYME
MGKRLSEAKEARAKWQAGVERSKANENERCISRLGAAESNMSFSQPCTLEMYNIKCTKSNEFSASTYFQDPYLNTNPGLVGAETGKIKSKMRVYIPGALDCGARKTIGSRYAAAAAVGASSGCIP